MNYKLNLLVRMNEEQFKISKEMIALRKAKENPEVMSLTKFRNKTINQSFDHSEKDRQLSPQKNNQSLSFKKNGIFHHRNRKDYSKIRRQKSMLSNSESPQNHENSGMCFQQLSLSKKRIFFGELEQQFQKMVKKKNLLQKQTSKKILIPRKESKLPSTHNKTLLMKINHNNVNCAKKQQKQYSFEYFWSRKSHTSALKQHKTEQSKHYDFKKMYEKPQIFQTQNLLILRHGQQKCAVARQMKDISTESTQNEMMRSRTGQEAFNLSQWRSENANGAKHYNSINNFCINQYLMNKGNKRYRKPQ